MADPFVLDLTLLLGITIATSRDFTFCLFKGTLFQDRASFVEEAGEAFDPFRLVAIAQYIQLTRKPAIGSFLCFVGLPVKLWAERGRVEPAPPVSAPYPRGDRTSSTSRASYARDPAIPSQDRRPHRADLRHANVWRSADWLG